MAKVQSLKMYRWGWECL